MRFWVSEGLDWAVGPLFTKCKTLAASDRWPGFRHSIRVLPRTSDPSVHLNVMSTMSPDTMADCCLMRRDLLQSVLTP